VKVIPIDALFNSSSSRFGQSSVSLLKIDAQGYEARVIKGASQLLWSTSQPTAVQFEFVPKMILGASLVGLGAGSKAKHKARRGSPALDLLDFMRDSGRMCFQMSHIDGRDFSGEALIRFEDFVHMHLEGPCPVLGCSSELICIPHCSIEGTAPTSELVKALMGVAGCTRNDLDDSAVVASLAKGIVSSVSLFPGGSSQELRPQEPQEPRMTLRSSVLSFL
jgi:hypothetical protein